MRRFVANAGIPVAVIVIAIQTLAGQLATASLAQTASDWHYWMMVLFGSMLLLILWCIIELSAEYKRRTRCISPIKQDSSSERSASARRELYDYGIRSTAELPPFLALNAPRRLPKTAEPEEWSVDREPPPRISQDDRLRLVR